MYNFWNPNFLFTSHKICKSNFYNTWFKFIQWLLSITVVAIHFHMFYYYILLVWLIHALKMNEKQCLPLPATLPISMSDTSASIISISVKSDSIISMSVNSDSVSIEIKIKTISDFWIYYFSVRNSRKRNNDSSFFYSKKNKWKLKFPEALDNWESFPNEKLFCVSQLDNLSWT